MRLDAAIKGDLKKYMKKEAEAAEKAVTEGIREVTNSVKQELRDQVTGAGMGGKLANAWRAKFYPAQGTSINQAGFVFSKVPEIISAFDEGVTIKSAKGFFLAIPTENAPKRGRDGKRINPSNFPETSMGKLRFIYRPGKTSLLVVDNLRASTGKRGGFKKASERSLHTGRGIASAVMFILVPQVTLKKRLNVEAVARRWIPKIGDSIIAHWPEVKDD